MQDLWLTCSPVPDSPLAGVPKYTRVPAFRVPGVPIGLPYCVQIIDAKVDFYPGDILTLPDELLPPTRAEFRADGNVAVWSGLPAAQFGLKLLCQGTGMCT